MSGFVVAYAKRNDGLTQYFQEISPRLLSASEVSRLQRFVQTSDRDLSFLGKLLLFHELKILGIGVPDLKSIEYNEFKRPHLKIDDRIIDFNISHSGELSIVAIAFNQRIGIDIEEMKPLKPHEFTSIFTSKELDWVGDDLNRFFTLWTRKESLVKALGKGFYHNVAGSEVLLDQLAINNTIYHFQPLQVQHNYICTAASEEKFSPARIIGYDIDGNFLANILGKLKP